MVFDNLFEYFGGGFMSEVNTFSYSKRFRFLDIGERSYHYNTGWVYYVLSQLLSPISKKTAPFRVRKCINLRHETTPKIFK